MNNIRDFGLLVTKVVDGVTNYKTTLTATVTWDGGEEVIPAGTTTDLGSMPKIVWWLLPPNGRYGVGTILHDYYNRTRGGPELIDVQESHTRFKHVMNYDGVRSWRKYVIYNTLKYVVRNYV